MDSMENETLACTCQNVTWEQIKEAYDKGADTYEEVQKATGCGIGCEFCVEEITKYIHQLRYDNRS